MPGDLALPVNEQEPDRPLGVIDLNDGRGAVGNQARVRSAARATWPRQTSDTCADRHAVV